MVFFYAFEFFTLLSTLIISLVLPRVKKCNKKTLKILHEGNFLENSILKVNWISNNVRCCNLIISCLIESFKQLCHRKFHFIKNFITKTVNKTTVAITANQKFLLAFVSNTWFSFSCPVSS